MEYTSCKYINHCLSFNDSRIVYCTVGNQTKCKQYAVLKENYNGEPIDWDLLTDRIEKDKESFRSGKIIECCQNCSMLTKRDWDKEASCKKFRYILFSNWYACNSACRYCWKDGKNFLIKNVDKNSEIDENDTYDIMPIVKDLINKNLLTEDAVIDFAGGEPTMYYKFNEALKMFVDAGIKHIVIHTNAIIFSKEIENAISKGIADVTVSIDAGTKKVHEKVKRVVSFDRVYENFEKYCRAKRPENNNKVCSKFIIVPNFNDSKDEISRWIEKSKQTRVSELALNADDCVFMTDNPDKKNLMKIKELTDFFLEIVKRENLRYFIHPNALFSYSSLGFDRPDYCG